LSCHRRDRAPGNERSLELAAARRGVRKLAIHWPGLRPGDTPVRATPSAGVAGFALLAGEAGAVWKAPSCSPERAISASSARRVLSSLRSRGDDYGAENSFGRLYRYDRGSVFFFGPVRWRARWWVTRSKPLHTIFAETGLWPAGFRRKASWIVPEGKRKGHPWK